MTNMPNIFSQDVSVWDLISYVFSWFYNVLTTIIPFSWPKILGVLGVVVFVLVINEKRSNKKQEQKRQEHEYKKLYKTKRIGNYDKPPPIPQEKE